MSYSKEIRKITDAQLKPVIPMVRSWFLREGLEFMKGKDLKNAEEKILEDFTDACLSSLDKMEGKYV